MTFNLDGFRPVRDRKLSARETWTPPTLDDLGYGIVIAFDQTLSATAGMCVHRNENALQVRGVKVLSGRTEATGNEGNLQKGVDLHRQLDFFLRGILTHHPDEQVTVVHEAPAVGGGVVRNPESSLLAAQALRIACSGLSLPVAPMVAPAAHKKVICGDSRADKGKEHQSLALLAESLPIHGYRAVSNGDKRDALCIAIAHLVRSK
jgi:hypothetical protein